MAETLSLLEFLQALLRDAALRGSFTHDPQGTLDEHGLGALGPADVHDALVLVQDTQTVDYSPDHLAAVEHLNSYLGDPDPQDLDAWSDPDDHDQVPQHTADLGTPGLDDDAGWFATPLGSPSSFGAGFAGAQLPGTFGADQDAPLALPDHDGTPEAGPAVPDAIPAEVLDDVLQDGAGDGMGSAGDPGDAGGPPHQGDLGF